MATILHRGASKSLNSLIVEYFDHLGFEDLTTKFLAECTVKGDPLPQKKSRILDSPMAIWEKLRVPFQAGAMEPFFQIWTAILGFWRKKTPLDSKEVSELTFKLQVYFATYPIRFKLPDAEKREAMRKFKAFLDERKVEGFGHDGEAHWILPCYALPFVQAPENHASFRGFFEDGWVEHLVAEMKDFWTSFLPTEIPRSEPKLLTIFKWHQHSRMKRQVTPNPGSHALTSISACSSRHSLSGNSSMPTSEKTDMLAPRETSMARESSPKILALRTRKRMVETDLWRTSVEHWRDKKRFNQLLGLAVEVSRAARDMHRGEPVNVHLTLSNCVSIMPDIFSTELREKRSVLRLEKSQQLKMDPMSMIHEALAEMPSFNVVCNEYEVQKLSSPNSGPSFDYASLKIRLKSDTPLKRALLFQALRWRITKESQSKIRELFVNELVEYDFLSLDGAQVKNSLRETAVWDYCGRNIPKMLEQSQIRMLCTLSAFPDGRSYLVEVEPLIVGLSKKLTSFTGTTNDDFTVRDLGIATLQKLSLRKRPTDLMLREEILEWLLTLLDRARLLEAYVIEYSSALLMNLCMRKEGKRRFSLIAVHGLRVLMSLMSLEKKKAERIFMYIHGTLNAVLEIPTVLKNAQSLKLEAQMKGYRAIFSEWGRSDLRLQADIIMRTVYSSAPVIDQMRPHVEEEEDSSDYESVDETRVQCLEEELDESDPVKGDLCTQQGAELLKEFFLAPKSTKRACDINETRSKSEIPARPMTPRGIIVKPVEVVFSADEGFSEDGQRIGPKGSFFAPRDPPNGIQGSVVTLSRGPSSATAGSPLIGRSRLHQTSAGNVENRPAKLRAEHGSCRSPSVAVSPAPGDGDEGSDGRALARKPNQLNAWRTVSTTTKVLSDDRPPATKLQNPSDSRWSGNSGRNSAQSGSAPGSPGQPRRGTAGGASGGSKTGGSGKIAPLRKTGNNSDQLSASDPGALTYTKVDPPRLKSSKRATSPSSAPVVPVMPCSPSKQQGKDRTKIPSPVSPRKREVPRRELSALQRNLPKKSSEGVQPIRRPPSGNDKKGAASRSPEGSPVGSNKGSKSPTVLPRIPLKSAVANGQSEEPAVGCRKISSSNVQNIAVGPKVSPSSKDGKGREKPQLPAPPVQQSGIRLKSGIPRATNSPKNTPVGPEAGDVGIQPSRIPSRAGRTHALSRNISTHVRSKTLGSFPNKPPAAVSASTTRTHGTATRAHRRVIHDEPMRRERLSVPGGNNGDENGCNGVPHYSLAGLRGFDPKDYQVAFGSKPKIPRTPPGSVADLRQEMTESESFGNDESSDNNDVVMGSLRPATTGSSLTSADYSLAEPAEMTNSAPSLIPKGYR